MRDDPAVIALVRQAADGDQTAWEQLVERYAPLVWSVCRRHQLDRSLADDVGQVVWLRLVECLPTLREAAALPGWIATTTRRECLRVLRDQQRRGQNERALPPDPAPGLAARTDTELPEAELLEAELLATLRAALGALSARCRQLLTLLIADPPVPYREISSRLQIPVGSIGPSRTRCLVTLRRFPALAALIEAREAQDAPR